MGRPKKRYETTAVNPASAHRDPTPTVNDPVARLDAKPLEHPRDERRYYRQCTDPCPYCNTVRRGKFLYSETRPGARKVYRRCVKCTRRIEQDEEEIT